MSSFCYQLAVIRKEVERSHDDFITEHFRKYNEPRAASCMENIGGYLNGNTL